VMTSILLPQAIRAMLPAIVSQVVVLLKDTALGFIIQLPELLYVGKQIGGRLPFGLPYVPSYLIVAAIYIGTCGLLSAFAFWLQRRLIGGKKPKKTAAPVPLPTDTGAGSGALL
jgi:glutamate transport system permease protein